MYKFSSNYVTIDQVAALGSFYESFLESGPQLHLQVNLLLRVLCPNDQATKLDNPLFWAQKSLSP